MSGRATVLFGGFGDALELFYWTGFSAEALYVRFDDGRDLLVVPDLEYERARQESRAKSVVTARQMLPGWVQTSDEFASWSHLCAEVAGEIGLDRLVVSPRLNVALFQALQARSLSVSVDAHLLREERRAKSDSEVESIRAAQQAAEAALHSVVRRIARATVDPGGGLWENAVPLTSEALMQTAHLALMERDHLCPDLIIAGSPGCALPHFRGRGQILAGAPVVIDIFPGGVQSHYHGDLTRTVVAGVADEIFMRAHAACLDALQVAATMVRPQVDGREVHRSACSALVGAGFGTTTEGLEGAAGGMVMNHSLGHGVGLSVHEAPYLRDSVYPLRERDVVTLEPGLYQAGLGGIRVEDLVVVGQAGAVNLVACPRSLNPEDYL